MKLSPFLISSGIFVIILFLASCENTNVASKVTTKTNVSSKEYLEKGKQIASATFATLSSNLQKAMKEGGVANAIKYCNLSAAPLVDSLENIHQAKIRRTSWKTRNPKNTPTRGELEQLQVYQIQDEAGEKMKPAVREIDEHTIAFYAPIHMMDLCQKCHGQLEETLLVEDYQTIKEYYPKDEAIGYAAGDWRGMWSISFKK